MYEEEDDDLPMQYRRLTAHLHTSNAEFDRRLAAYLTNHVAMRAALGQAGLQNTSYPNAAQFANSGASPQPTSGSFPQSVPNMNPFIGSPSLFTSPPPIATPTATMQSPAHHRSASIANVNELESKKGIESKIRRPSLPVTAADSGDQPASKRLKSSHNLKLENLPKPMDSNPAFKPEMPTSQNFYPPMNGMQTLRPSEFPAGFDASMFNPIGNAMSSMPFSTALPPEAQQLLGGAFDNTDPMTSMLMGSNLQRGSSDYSYGAGFSKNQTFNSLDQTLAPGFLDTSVDKLESGPKQDSAIESESPFTTSAGPYGSGYDDWQKFNPYDLGSGNATPSGDRDWQSFIDGNAWGDEQTSNI